MKTLQKILVIVPTIVVLLVITYFILVYLETKSYDRKGEALINKIEEYRKQTGRLPNTVENLGLQETMDMGPHYEKIDSLEYYVYFNIGFDSFRVYESGTKKWYDRP